MINNKNDQFSSPKFRKKLTFVLLYLVLENIRGFFKYII